MRRYSIFYSLLAVLLVIISVFSPVSASAVMAAEAQEPFFDAEIRVRFPESGGTAEIEENKAKTSLYSSPKIEKDTITVGNGQTGRFVIHCDIPGTYEYIVRQVVEKKEAGVTYDDTEYHVTLFVASKEDGTPYQEIAVFKGDSIKKSKEVLFENKKKSSTKKKTASNKTAKGGQSGSGGGGKGGGAKTGDTKELFVWTSVTLAGAILFAVMLFSRRRREH